MAHTIQPACACHINSSRQAAFRQSCAAAHAYTATESLNVADYCELLADLGFAGDGRHDDSHFGLLLLCDGGGRCDLGQQLLCLLGSCRQLHILHCQLTLQAACLSVTRIIPFSLSQLEVSHMQSDNQLSRSEDTSTAHAASGLCQHVPQRLEYIKLADQAASADLPGQDPDTEDIPFCSCLHCMQLHLSAGT